MFVSLINLVKRKSMEELTSTDCYQCREDHKESPELIKKALSGSLFPFCSKECKEKWADKNFGKKIVNEHKYKTIEECQKRILEWRTEKLKSTIVITDKQGNDITEVARMIFG